MARCSTVALAVALVAPANAAMPQQQTDLGQIETPIIESIGEPIQQNGGNRILAVALQNSIPVSDSDVTNMMAAMNLLVLKSDYKSGSDFGRSGIPS